jgi:hypothetical protein
MLIKDFFIFSNDLEMGLKRAERNMIIEKAKSDEVLIESFDGRTIRAIPVKKCLKRLLALLDKDAPILY